VARSKEALCLGIAEQGKILALNGNHEQALRHYREALRIAMSCSFNEIFFHHCSQCIMESLELSGGHELVADYCIRAEDHYAAIENSDDIIRRQRGANLERLAASRLLSGNIDEAKALFATAIETAGKGALPLCEEVLSWMRRGLNVGAPQLRSAQQRHKYFVVRKDLVDARIAVELPSEVVGAPHI
jgi:tetratricopeptide (TPR) repeat protein